MSPNVDISVEYKKRDVTNHALIEEAANKIAKLLRQHLSDAPEYFQSALLVLMVERLVVTKTNCDIKLHIDGHINQIEFDEEWSRRNDFVVSPASVNHPIASLVVNTVEELVKSDKKRLQENRAIYQVAVEQIVMEIAPILDEFVPRPDSPQTIRWNRIRLISWIVFGVAFIPIYA